MKFLFCVLFLSVVKLFLYRIISEFSCFLSLLSLALALSLTGCRVNVMENRRALCMWNTTIMESDCRKDFINVYFNKLFHSIIRSWKLFGKTTLKAKDLVVSVIGAMPSNLVTKICETRCNLIQGEVCVYGKRWCWCRSVLQTQQTIHHSLH